MALMQFKANLLVISRDEFKLALLLWSNATVFLFRRLAFLKFKSLFRACLIAPFQHLGFFLNDNLARPSAGPEHFYSSFLK